MKERVELNNNGRSIESHCKVYCKNKWESRYIVSKIQIDLEDPILNFYKCRKDRLRDKIKQSIILQNYIAYEKSFPLKNKNQTIAVITKNSNIILAFHLAETLLQWETWFKNIGGQSTTHYMQLLKYPNIHENPTFANKEVRCHLHDHRLAIVYNIPAETLLYCEVSAASIHPDLANHLIYIKPNHNRSEEFILSCPAIDNFVRYLEKAQGENGSLNQYLNKKQAEGVWLQNISKRPKNQDSISHWSDTLSGFFNFMNQPSTSANHSETLSSRNAVNNINLNNPRNVMKTPSGSRKFRNNSIFEQPLMDSNYVNTFNSLGISDYEAQRKSASLPEYVNVQHMIRNHQNEVIHRKTSTMTTPNDPQRFSNATERHFSAPKTNPKGRSMIDFTSLPYDGSESRYENWRKAKKFISAFSPKSQQELNRSGKGSKKIKKSSSTSALTYDLQENNSNLATTSSMSELDDLPISLNIALSNPCTIMSTKDFKDPDEPPAGLVRVREEPTLKYRGGVNIVLARRLAAGVNGSFTKYDGDRGTHIYQRKLKTPTNETKNDSQENSDAIETAISRERDKMKQIERRASSVSFQKSNQIQVNLLDDIHKKALETSSAPRHSSYSETNSGISSSESLSSDARSKISIKKRSNSPPRDIAPAILPKHPSQRTLTLQKQSSSSADSLNSQQTAKTVSSLRLPTRVLMNNSSSSEDNGTSHYKNFVESQERIYHYSTPRNQTRRMSEGHGTIADKSLDNTVPVRKGYFRKNNKSRKSQRHLNISSPQMF